MRILLLSIFLWFAAIAFGNDSVPDYLAMQFNKQLSIFPQEKIYLHTDKPYYISGENVWFRAYLSDALSHIPSPISRYVYVELIDPLDSIVNRVKIRQENGAYIGFMPIPADVPEGDFTMRAYTSFMQSLDENYLYTKSIRIGDPQAREIRTDANFTFESDRKINVLFRFTNARTSEKIIPKSVKLTLNNGKSNNLKIDNEGNASANLTLPAASQKRVILLETQAYSNPLYRQFIQIPVPDNDFDVTFYPEGGSLMTGIACRLAFKAMKSNGQAENITGTVFDQSGNTIGEFNSSYQGMGSFTHISEKDKSYYAVCVNDKGQSKRFDLPAALNNGYALSITQMRDRLYISALKPAEMNDDEDIYLLAHTRGYAHFINPWDHERKIITINKDQFPTGVLNFVLFDARLNPISERLVFINNQDQAQVNYQPEKDNYPARSLVKNSVTIANSEGQPLSGSFSVSVTSDNEVTPDTTTNILTYLLLTSDLRGNIENPAYYFKNTNSASWALDLLLCTQGWRRYNIAELAQGNFAKPTSPLEIGPEISGVVKSVLLGKPVEDIVVSVMSFKDSITGNYFENDNTDVNGRFALRGGEMPNGTWFVVSAIPKKGMTRLELLIDSEKFPQRTLPAVVPAGVDRMFYEKYVDKAEQKYITENGVRIYQLTELTITAEQKPPRKSAYYSSPSNSITEDELEKFPATDVRTLLQRLPGVMVSGNSISIRGGGTPLLIVDDLPTDIEYIDMINIYDIAQIDVLKDAGNTAMFGSRGGNGVIVIFTKEGKINPIATKPFHIKTIVPLGYQQAAEFYAPKYDTPSKRAAQASDLRTTIHWQPIVETDSLGMASFEFYAADDKSSYTVVIEGLTEQGMIIRKEGIIWRRD